MKVRRRTPLAVALLVSSVQLCGLAQDAGKAARDLALYRGADRHDRLVALAKKEGGLTVYHVYPELRVAMAAFTKKYGITIKPWRAGSETVLQRVNAEARAGRVEVDVVQNNAPENEAAYREQLLQEAWSPSFKDLLPVAVPAHHGWAGITMDIWTAAYNTNAVKKEELPASYADLADPRWKGRLAVEAYDHAWFGTLMGELGEVRGAKIFDTIVATNGISVRRGHSLLANLVASGDVPFALTVYSWIPEQLKKKGAPIEIHAIQPLLAQPSTIALMRRAPHPASALLFYDFLLGREGQQVLAASQFVPTNTLIKGPLADVPMKFVDPARVLDLQDEWRKIFNDAVVRRAR